MDITSEHETSYTTQYQEAFLKNVENKYYTKHQRLLVTKPKIIPNRNLISSRIPSTSGQSSYNPYDLYSNDEEYLMLKSVAEKTPRRSDRAACLLKAARLNWHSPPKLPHNWGQINLNLNDYNSDPMEISSTLWLPNITDWWWQQEDYTQSMPISPMWHVVYSLSYLTVSEWRPVFPFSVM
jgi:hypothetical protein